MNYLEALVQNECNAQQNDSLVNVLTKVPANQGINAEPMNSTRRLSCANQAQQMSALADWPCLSPSLRSRSVVSSSHRLSTPLRSLRVSSSTNLYAMVLDLCCLSQQCAAARVSSKRRQSLSKAMLCLSHRVDSHVCDSDHENS